MSQVNLPDGRIQTVTYVADHYGGYNAQVSYSGENPLLGKYPEYVPNYPLYKPRFKYAPLNEVLAAYKAVADARDAKYGYHAQNRSCKGNKYTTLKIYVLTINTENQQEEQLIGFTILLFNYLFSLWF